MSRAARIAHTILHAAGFVVSFAAGGSNDIMARLVGQKLSESMGQQVVVDNRAGAGGNIGMGLAAQASPDGFSGEEGTFSICSFWYVEALTRAGRLDDARLAFEKMLTYANHVGLYAEQIAHTGEQLGNFPQAFTHLALISAAVNLDRALG